MTATATPVSSTVSGWVSNRLAPQLVVCQRRSTLLLVIGATTLLALLSHSVLAPKYFFDSLFVQELAQGTTSVPADSEYTSAAHAYKLLHLQNSPHLVALITMLVYAVAVWFATGRDGLATAKTSTLVVLYASSFLTAIYVAMYSKEAVVLVAGLVLLLLSRLRIGLVAMVAFMVVYSLEFRLYWLLVAIVCVMAHVAMAKQPSGKRIALVAVMGLVVIAVAVAAKYHESVSVFRINDNIGRVGSTDANTIIPQYIPGSSYIAGFFDSVITLPLLLFPLPLLLHPGPQYYLAALFLAMVSSRLGSGMIEMARYVSEEPTDRMIASGLWCSYAALALAIVQSAYVPDYGSAMKHLTPILPLVVNGLMAKDSLDARRRLPGKAHPVST